MEDIVPDQPVQPLQLQAGRHGAEYPVAYGDRRRMLQLDEPSHPPRITYNTGRARESAAFVSG